MSEQPFRLFKSKFLEFFTHVSPVAIYIIWLPVVGVFIFFTINALGFNWILPLGVISGLFFWTFAEYILHRFLFHFPASTKWQKRVSYLFHGIHHHQPKVKTR